MRQHSKAHPTIVLPSQSPSQVNVAKSPLLSPSLFPVVSTFLSSLPSFLPTFLSSLLFLINGYKFQASAISCHQRSYRLGSTTSRSISEVKHGRAIASTVVGDDTETHGGVGLPNLLRFFLARRKTALSAAPLLPPRNRHPQNRRSKAVYDSSNG